MAEKPRVLVVDDHEVNIDLIEAYLTLKDTNIEIYKARSATDVEEIVSKVALDLIILDVMLPDRSGYEICRDLKNDVRYRAIPILMITALSDKKNMLAGLTAGADEFLTKPVDKDELYIRVRNLLRMKSITNDMNAAYMRLHKELALATELQKSFLPKKLPNLSGLSMNVLYKPSSFIGGDFYDVIEIDKHHLGVLICDVKGHGVASAMITATIKFQLSTLHQYMMEPARLLRNLNERLYDFFNNTTGDIFVTAFYGVLDLRDRSMYYSNAGHTEPCVADINGIRFLDNENGLPLGIFQNQFYQTEQVTMQSGDTLFLYTDGLYELRLDETRDKPCTCLPELFPEGTVITMKEIYDLQEQIRDYVEAHQIPDDVNYIAINFR